MSQILPQNFVHGSYRVFIVFQQINVKQKHGRAQSIFRKAAGIPNNDFRELGGIARG